MLEARTEVEYVAHLGWGAVKVKLPDGSIEIVHPHLFPQLR